MKYALLIYDRPGTYDALPDESATPSSASTSPRAILRRNLFVERFIPAGTTRELSTEEMDHYRRVQATPDARIGVAELPRQIVAATPFLAGLAEAVWRAAASAP